jgi:glutamate synthase (NADPH/NADH) small chain
VKRNSKLEDLNKKFEKIKPQMTPSEAVVESSRCLFCHDAPCIIACPTSIDIPMFIRQIMTKNTLGSAKTIFSQNILGKSCGQVCPTSVLCEGACVYHDLNEKPIDIGRLQAYATGHAIDKNIHFFEKGKSTGKKVAIIGAGPAGLACAHELTMLGHKVVVYEANKKAGGLNMYGVAPYKFSNKDAIQELKYVSAIGFEIKTNSPIENPSKLEKEFDAIFLGAGLGGSKKINIPGEDLSGVYGATEFIYNLRDKDLKVNVGKNVVVIGGGNTAIDAAVESSLLGASVTVIYRRSEKEQTAYSFEVEHAKKHDVKFVYLTSPIEILGKKKVDGLKCIKNKLKSSSRKSEINTVKDSQFVIPCDMVIIARGQEKMIDFFKSISKLKLDDGKVVVNKDFQTTNPKYFAGGDCINGGKEVVNAVANGRDAARGIDKYLMKKK